MYTTVNNIPVFVFESEFSDVVGVHDVFDHNGAFLGSTVFEGGRHVAYEAEGMEAAGLETAVTDCVTKWSKGRK